MSVKIIVCKGCGGKMEAVDEQGNPACITCAGISPNNSIPVEMEVPDIAKCVYCGKEAQVTQDLPFYNSRNNTYYCGCRGWD